MPTRSILTLGLALALVGPAAQAQQTKADGAMKLRETLIGLDANNDMAIDRDEVPESALPAFERLLKRGDANKNGRLEGEEMRGLFEKLRALGDPAAMAARVKAMDKDEDGKITKEEFTGPEPLFKQLDANGDGAISKDERPKLDGAPVRGAIGQRLKAMDKDDDGKITRAEYQGPPMLFDRLDADKDGVVTKEEVAKLVADAPKPVDAPKKPETPKRPEGRPLLGAMADRLKAMDKDEDGKITKEEFTGPEPLFKQLDANGDGAISKDERPKLDGAPVRGAIGQRLKAMDKDDDGKISRDEFPGRAPLFDRLDADKDGFLSTEELSKGRPGGARAKRRPETGAKPKP